MTRFLIVMALLGALVGCAAAPQIDAVSEDIVYDAYAPEGPPKLTLITVVNNNTGQGGHTALMVSASEQVIFDPAGSFRDDRVPERGDVLFGMSPAWVQAYKSAHARSTYHVVTQEIVVSPEQAERALALVRARGSVPSAFCARSTSDILRQIPGFETVRTTFFPINLMEQIAARPDVVTDRYYENDAGDVRDGIAAVQG